jgi:hypothetical protein
VSESLIRHVLVIMGSWPALETCMLERDIKIRTKRDGERSVVARDVT